MSYGTATKLRSIGENYEMDGISHPGYRAAPYPTYPIAPYPLAQYPLGQLPDAAPLPGRFSLANINVRQVLAVLAVLLIAVVVMYYLTKLTKKTAKVERNAVVTRLSTKELATRLYDRLEAKGSRTNTTTMRSLERLSR